MSKASQISYIHTIMLSATVYATFLQPLQFNSILDYWFNFSLIVNVPVASSMDVCIQVAGCSIPQVLRFSTFDFAVTRCRWTHEPSTCWAFSVSWWHQGKLQISGIPFFSLHKTFEEINIQVLVIYNLGIFFSLFATNISIAHQPYPPPPYVGYSAPLNAMQSCTLMYMQQCTWKYCTAGQTGAGTGNQSWGNHSLSCTHTDFFAIFIHLSLTRILKAVVISRSNPPSRNEKAITIGFSPIPVAWQRCPKPASPPAFSSPSASLSDSLLFPCTSSPFHCGCRLSLFLHPLCSLSLSLLPSLSSRLLWVLDGSLSQWLINTGIDPLAKCL